MRFYPKTKDIFAPLYRGENHDALSIGWNNWYQCSHPALLGLPNVSMLWKVFALGNMCRIIHLSDTCVVSYICQIHASYHTYVRYISFLVILWSANFVSNIIILWLGILSIVEYLSLTRSMGSIFSCPGSSIPDLVSCPGSSIPDLGHSASHSLPL